MPARPPGQPPDLLLIGAYGMANLGDDAILAAMLDELRPVLPGARFAIVAQDTGALPVADDLRPIPFEDRAIQEALIGKDLLIIGGGGLLFDFRIRASYDEFSNDRATDFYPHYRAALAACRLGIPVYFYAVGVGPLISPVGRELTRRVCACAAAITVRDQLSRAELVGLGIPPEKVEVTADPAVRLPSPDGPRAGGGNRPRIGFAVRDWFPVTAPGAVQLPHGSAYLGRYLDQFAAAADHVVAQRGGEAIFFAVQDEVDDDRRYARQVLARMAHGQRATIVEATSYRDLQALIAGLDLVISTRLHGVIFAASALIPAIGINLNTKIRAFLIDLGLPELAVSPWGGSPGALTALIDRVLDHPAAFKERLATGMAAQREAAARNPTICARLLVPAQG
jgi:polysaccharide pyruvyl transferase WcaK-like protein